jgi:hypothetical protein
VLLGYSRGNEEERNEIITMGEMITDEIDRFETDLRRGGEKRKERTSCPPCIPLL